MLCIYHSKDLDGFTSGAIVKRKFPDIKMIGWDYGEGIPWDDIPWNEEVIMIDISFPMEDMIKVSEKTDGRLTWIDHHLSAKKDYDEYKDSNKHLINYVYKLGIAACEIAWGHFFPEEEMPESVLLLGQYDTWRKDDEKRWQEKILPFQYYMRLKFLDPEKMPFALLEEDYHIEICITNGKLILDYQREQDKRAMKGSFVCNFEGLKALCCNIGGASSNTFLSVWDENKHDVMIPFFYSGKRWTFSLYTTKDEVDCSVIAKKLGGGHKKASGFILQELPATFKKE